MIHGADRPRRYASSSWVGGPTKRRTSRGRYPPPFECSCHEILRHNAGTPSARAETKASESYNNLHDCSSIPCARNASRSIPWRPSKRRVSPSMRYAADSSSGSAPCPRMPRWHRPPSKASCSPDPRHCRIVGGSATHRRVADAHQVQDHARYHQHEVAGHDQAEPYQTENKLAVVHLAGTRNDYAENRWYARDVSVSPLGNELPTCAHLRRRFSLSFSRSLAYNAVGRISMVARGAGGSDHRKLASALLATAPGCRRLRTPPHLALDRGGAGGRPWSGLALL
jgi:hypothetical protein